MKIIFMGTPSFAVPSLNALIARHEVVAVFTQPDRPAGRGFKLAASPVKEAAIAADISVFQPETLKLPNAKEIREKLASFNADIFIVAAYGLILPKGVLSMPPHGCVNVHASLLPKYRGASPIHSAILNGDDETGITIMQMDAGVDTGDIILQKSLPIFDNERFPTLHDRLAELGGEALLYALEQIENSTAKKIPQENSLSSYSPMIQKNDGKINWQNSSEKIINQTRALDPWPGCFTALNGQPLKIWQCVPVENFSSQEPGTVLSSSDKLIIKTGDGAILVTELQAVGKKRMPATDFLRGQKMEVGIVLGAEM
jgi:methionyl-tRNA formyltransferase